MKSEIKKEIVLTLNDDEIRELKDFMIKCPHIWIDGELMSSYVDTVVSNLWKALHI